MTIIILSIAATALAAVVGGSIGYAAARLLGLNTEDERNTARP